jgi:Na+-translocating membrane potential-generating system MpsC-like protein
MEGSAGPGGEVRAGQLNAAIANEIGKLTADFTGRGSERSRAFITGDVVVCLLENGATRGEQNIAAAGRADVVRLVTSCSAPWRTSSSPRSNGSLAGRSAPF